MKKNAIPRPWITVPGLSRGRPGGVERLRIHSTSAKTRNANVAMPRGSMPTSLPTTGRRSRRMPTGASTHPAGGGGVAHELLQPQRQQHHVAEEGRRPPTPRGVPSPNCAARTTAGRPPGARVSSRTKNTKRHPAARCASSAISARVEPVEFAALSFIELQRAHPEHQQRQADVSIGSMRSAGFALVDRPGRTAASRPDRHVDKKIHGRLMLSVIQPPSSGLPPPKRPAW